MTLTYSIIGAVTCALLWLFIGWREKKRELGTVPLFSPHLVQFLLLILFFVFAAQIFSQATGVTWTPPHMR